MKKKNKSYQFTLIMKSVNENTPHLEDSLHSAGCNDALIHFRDGGLFMDFDRESDTFEEAVNSAIKQVEACSIEVSGVSY